MLDTRIIGLLFVCYATATFLPCLRLLLAFSFAAYLNMENNRSIGLMSVTPLYKTALCALLSAYTLEYFGTFPIIFYVYAAAWFTAAFSIVTVRNYGLGPCTLVGGLALGLAKLTTWPAVFIPLPLMNNYAKARVGIANRLSVLFWIMFCVNRAGGMLSETLDHFFFFSAMSTMSSVAWYK